MKPFACTYCEYSSNYAHNLKRHLLRHGLQQSNLKDQRVEEQQSTSNEQQQISSGYPTQALNLSNNIQIPPTTKQIINIHPPKNTTFFKKPIIHGENYEYFDVRLKENFKLFISGPSRSGKTIFVKKFLKNLNIFTKAPPQILTVVYKVFQPIYNEMGVDHLVQDGHNLKQRLLKIANGEPMLIIFDDMINSDSLGELSDLFVVDGRHMNLSMVFISQKMFVNNEDFRQISQNCDYYVVFKNPRNAQEIRNLASQMTPGKMELISYYMDATQEPFSYLFINLTQECQPQVKYLSDLFSESHNSKAYFDSTSKELIDGINHIGRNYSRMFFKKNNFPSKAFYKHAKTNVNADVETGSIPMNSTGVGTDFIPMNNVRVGTERGRDQGTYSIPMNNVGVGTDFIPMKNAGIGTDFIPMNDIGVGAERGREQGTYSIPMKNVEVGTDFITMKNAGVGTDFIPMNEIGVGVERGREQGTYSIPMKNIGIGTDSIPMKNVGVGTDFIPMNDIGVGVERGREQGTYSIPMKNIGIGSDSIPMNNIDVGTDFIPMNSINDSTERMDESDMVIPYDKVHSYHAAQDLRMKNYSRPERDWRLNEPIYNLIRRPANRYKNYIEYIDDNTEPKSLLYENETEPKSLLYENETEPRSLLYEDYENDNAEQYAVVPYQEYINYNENKCFDCEEVFHSNKALRRHKTTCKPTLYACNVCGINLSSRNLLTNHVKSMHQTRRDIRKIKQRR